MKNIEIERKYHSKHELKESELIGDDVLYYKTSVSRDRYYICPSGLIRLRDDEEKGIELTAKTYKTDNLHRREINLPIPSQSDINDCIEFADVAGWTLRLEFKQHLQIWITNTVCISQTLITDINDNPYHYSREQSFITDMSIFPLARFIEIEAIDPEDRHFANNQILRYQNLLGLSKRDIVKYSLVQLFGAYPRK